MNWLDLERLRWGGPPPACPRCGVEGRCARLPGHDGGRRVWRCAACRGQFSVLTGTLLEGTRLPLPVWRALVADAVSGTPAPARALAREWATTPETVRTVRARLRAAGVSGTGGAGGTDAALADLLRLPPAEVRRVLAGTPARRAAHYGPGADYR